MAFLPALPVAPTAVRRSRKSRPRRRDDTKKSYRISLSNIDVATRDDIDSSSSHNEPRLDKEDYIFRCVENSVITSTGNSFLPKLCEHQNVKKPQHCLTEPVIPRCSDSMISERSMIWMEPLGLWIPLKQGRRFYEKFSNRMDLLYKDPDYLMDPCPHIPRCDHSRSWSAVKLERQKFRELSQLRQKQLLQKTVEKYQGMQDLWLQQLNSRSEVLQNTSTQERLENFRKLAGEHFNPLNEKQRLERLQERRQEWENAWRTASERRGRDSRKKQSKGCLFPRIKVTDYDNDVNVAARDEHVNARAEHTEARDGQMKARDEHVEARDEHVEARDQYVEARAEHVKARDEHQYTKYECFNEKYDTLCIPVDCFSQLEENMHMVEQNGAEFLPQQVDFVYERTSELRHKESFAVIRRTPRVDDSDGGLRPGERLPRLSIKRKRGSGVARCFKHHERSFVPRRSEPMESEESEDTNKWDVQDSSSSSSTSGVGPDTSVSIDALIDISRSNLALSTMLLNNSIRDADNTVQIMSHLVPLPLGMTSGKILDGNITASSILDVYHAADQARLSNEKKDSNGGAWIPRLYDVDPYLEIDLGHVLTVQQVATQGNPASAVKKDRHKRWVTKFCLAFSEDGKEWTDYEESGRLRIFTGNSDLDTIVLNSLESPIETRFIRFKPKEWHTGIAMRVEVFGPQPLPDEKIKTPTPELELDLTDPTETDIQDTVEDDTVEELDQMFSEMNGNSENEEFCVLEGRAITPATLHSPVLFLVSPNECCIEQKDWMESKVCLNSLPIRKSQTSVTEKTSDEEQRMTNTDEQLCRDDNNQLSPTVPEQEPESEPTELQDSDGAQQPMTVDPTESMENDHSSALQENWVRDLERARTDGSIERQLRREKIADGRRKKLALLNSRKTRHWSEPSCLIEEADELGSFLEKYCIIGKPERIIYKKVFEKFDEDEDGFLWPEEVLEALENVNTKLLTDSHLNYVFRILELCDCHAESGIGIRIFSVIAALSQRVAALNDKMKLLISRCDFKTIDCTLLRAKLLFECYVNEHTKKISRTDLWIGLAAGGLRSANETIDNYFEEKQSFDFLDFLTYLPLFEVIHRHAVENPLTVF